MKPKDAKYKFDFTIGANDFSIGLYALNVAPHEEILTPVMLLKNGAAWDEIFRYDTLWNDIQEDIDPETMAGYIVSAANKALEKYSEGGEMTWNQKLGAIFQLRMALVNEQIIIK